MTFTTAIESQRAAYLNEMETLWYECACEDPRPCECLAEITTPAALASAPTLRRALLDNAVEEDEFPLGVCGFACCDGD